MNDNIKLTQFSHGAGCGCKISPSVLQNILQSNLPAKQFSHLIVGNETCDDAAVYEWDKDNYIISTTDFFMPIVDDAKQFGCIASANAISDVYAMGGEPMMAIGILGWPINKISVEVARDVLEGARQICNEANIPLAGGHSIDSPEPIFGLAVTGKVKKEHLKQNSTAISNSLLYLTKPLGAGIITTAQKKGVAKKDHLAEAVEQMMTLNKAGSVFGKMAFVNSLTDVTGFGLLGHLIEMAEGSGLSAEVYFSQVPRYSFLNEYVEQKCFPGGTTRNLESYKHKVTGLNDEYAMILADPQTSGGLLVSVDKSFKYVFEEECKNIGLSLSPFGELRERNEKGVVNVIPFASV